MDSEVIGLLERRGVGIRAGLAVCAVLDGRYGEAADLCGALAGGVETTSTWSRGARGQETLAQPGPDVGEDGEKKRGRPSKPKGRRENVSQRTRVCSECGEEKGITGFASGGGTVCLKCRKTKGGKVADPGLKLVRCVKCGRALPASHFDGDSRFCDSCVK